MNLEELKALITQFDTSSLRELHFENKEVHLLLSKNEHVSQTSPQEKSIEPTISLQKEKKEKEEVKIPTTTYYQVKAPLIGTFYSQASPEEANFVEVGDHVKKGQTIGIIEAMKVMNEIPAPVSGIVKNIFVKNQSPVEYDAILLEVEED